MGVKVLADKKHKFTILTTKPAVESNPTATELNGGIEACLKVSAENFTFRPTASDSIEFKTVCGVKEDVMTDENFEMLVRVVRYYLEGGGIDPAADELFTALKTRGTTLWAYGRLSDQNALEPWVDGDEIHLGVRFAPDNGAALPEGWIQAEFPCKVQDGWTFRTVGGEDEDEST